MKRWVRLTVMGSAVWALAAAGASGDYQFPGEDLARRAEIERILKTAEIVEAKEIGTGVTRPYKVHLKGGDIECDACWKNPKGEMFGYLEGWQYEIAAYAMDKLLGINMIPPTVERDFKGKPGALQFWVTSEMSDLHRMENEIKIPDEFAVRWTKQKYILRAFDSLIGNEDRTQENVLYIKDWRMVLIDHSRSFRSTWKFTNRLMYGRNGIKGQFLFRMLPRAFVEKVEALTFDQIKAAVGDYLTKAEINAILKRRQLLLDEIADMIQEKGESAVLY